MVIMMVMIDKYIKDNALDAAGETKPETVTKTENTATKTLTMATTTREQESTMLVQTIKDQKMMGCR